MTYYAVIDTNVVVSALLKSGSFPSQILQYAFNGVIIPILNKDIIFEYKDVLSRNKFDFSEDEINNVLTALMTNSVFVENLDQINDVFMDKDDAVFYQVVMTTRKEVDTYLITGNIKHFPAKSYVVTPREMVEIIEKAG